MLSCLLASSTQQQTLELGDSIEPSVLAFYTKPVYKRIGLGPFPSVAGLTEDTAVYGFLSSICSNTATLSLWCFTGRIIRWACTSFAARLKRITSRESAILLGFWARIFASRLCQVTNMVATITGVFDWIIHPAWHSREGLAIRRIFMGQVAYMFATIREHVCPKALFLVLAASTFATLALVMLYVFFTSADSRLTHASAMRSMCTFLATYSGLAYVLRSAYWALGIFADSSLFIVCTICSEQFLVYTIIRFLHPSVAAMVCVTGHRVWPIVCSVASGLIVRFAFGRLLEASSIRHMALRISARRLAWGAGCQNQDHAARSCKKSVRNLYWVVLYGSLGIQVPCVFGLPILAETVF